MSWVKREKYRNVSGTVLKEDFRVLCCVLDNFHLIPVVMPTHPQSSALGTEIETSSGLSDYELEEAKQ